MRIYFIIFFLIPFTLFSQGGKWNIIDTNAIKPLLNCIDCYDSLNCVVFGNDHFNEPYNRVTSDGGKTWVTTLRDTQILGQYYPTKVYDVAYPDSSLCIAACGDGYYWESRDKCQTWERKKMGVGKNFMYVHFLDKDNGVIQAGQELFITRDGARSWEHTNCSSVFVGGCHNAKVISPGIVYTIVYRYDGSFLGRTYDYGKSWDMTDEIKYKRFSNIIFFDKNTGFGIGGSGVPNTNYYNELIEKTTDAGETWRVKLDTIVKKQNGRLFKGSFYKKKYGVVINQHGHIWKTHDAGETWYYDTTYPKEWADIGGIHWLTKEKIIAANKFYSQIIMYSEEITDVEGDYPVLDDDILISPNPAGDYIDISTSSVMLNEMKNPVIKIYDVLGVCVLTTSPPAPLQIGEGRKVRLDVSGLAAGVYFVRVGQKVLKFVKL